jgi:hypothetical protein
VRYFTPPGAIEALNARLGTPLHRAQLIRHLAECRIGMQEDADRFISEFGGERMHPSERGKGKRWPQWRKGSYRPC